MNTALTEKLTEPERRKFNDLDGIIRKGLQTFAEVGASLAIIRDQRLYREEYDTFEAYCQDRCGWTRQRAAQLIGASEVVTELSTMVDTDDLNERQARALLDVPPEHRAEVLREAQADAEALRKPVTAKHIKATGAKHALPKPRKPKAESPADMAAAIVAAAIRQAEAATEPTPVPNDPPAVIEAETEPVEGKVVVFIRSLAVPDAGDVEGMTEADVHEVRLLQAWCGRVIAGVAKARALAA